MTTKKRKHFGTDGIRGRFGDHHVSPEFMLKLGWAVGRVFASQRHSKVLIGKDTRISGYVLESALESGLAAAGVDVQLLGPMPTPAIAYLTRTFHAKAGIVISASHNPFYDNGVKFFGADGKKLSDELELRIEAELEKPLESVSSDLLGKAVRIDDAPGRYIEFCKGTAPGLDLQGLTIVIDCAHGATYHIAPSVFRELGATVIETAVNPNGLNINQGCGATDLKTLQEVVLAQKADLGIAFDGDGDRVMMVDDQGCCIDGDEILYIIARHAKNSGTLNGGVVGTVMTNLGIENSIKALGVEFVRTPVGDRHVMAELSKRSWYFGGEGSGHIVCLNKTSTGDGIVTALQVLAAIADEKISLHELHQSIEKFPQLLINVKVGKRVDPLTVPAIAEAVEKAEQRLQENGRLLLRASGTEPLIRVMVEGRDQAQVKQEAEQLAETVRAEIV